MAQGKRAGSRRGSRRPARLSRATLAPGLAALVAMIAWGLLVWFAIDFGARARAGEGRAWWVMGGLGVAAMAALFLALMMIVRVSRAVGLTEAPAATSHLAPPDRPGAGDPPTVAPVNPYAGEEAPSGAAVADPDDAARRLREALGGSWASEPGDTAERPAMGRHLRPDA